MENNKTQKMDEMCEDDCHLKYNVREFFTGKILSKGKKKTVKHPRKKTSASALRYLACSRYSSMATVRGQSDTGGK